VNSQQHSLSKESSYTFTDMQLKYPTCRLHLKCGNRKTNRKNCPFPDGDKGRKEATILYSLMTGAEANQVLRFTYVRELVIGGSGHSLEMLPDD